VNIIIGILALLLGVLALFAFDAFSLDDHVAPWLVDLLALVVMFVLIAAITRGSTSNARRPHAP
jgi:hypothetical protein